MRRGRRRRPSAHRASRGRRAARRRQRRRRRGGRVLMSFVAESPLTGPGAGGFMLVHTARRRGPPARLLRRRARPRPRRARAGRAHADRRPLLRGRRPALQRRPVVVRRLRHHARPGRRRSSASARWRSPTGGAGRRAAAREGVEVVPMQAFLFEILEPILRSTPECSRAVRARRRAAARGRHDSACRSSATCSSGSAPRARTSSTRATWRGACSDWVLERGGLLTREDLAAYEVVEREPARVTLPRPARCSPTRRRRPAGS